MPIPRLYISYISLPLYRRKENNLFKWFILVQNRIISSKSYISVWRWHQADKRIIREIILGVLVLIEWGLMGWTLFVCFNEQLHKTFSICCFPRVNPSPHLAANALSVSSLRPQSSERNSSNPLEGDSWRPNGTL